MSTSCRKCSRLYISARSPYLFPAIKFATCSANWVILLVWALSSRAVLLLLLGLGSSNGEARTLALVAQLQVSASETFLLLELTLVAVRLAV